MSASFLEHFSTLEDPRIERCKRHALLDILFLSVCAVLSGAEGWEAIEDYGHIKLEWLRKFVPLANGIPRHDTIARVLSRLAPEGLQHAFMVWMQAVSEVTAGEVVAIDGKTLRRSFDRASRKSALHMVSAWASGNGVVLGQIKTEDKSNEITAVPSLLNALELKGCIVTLDAMGCQRAIAQQIVEKKADYVLTVKANQGVLHEDIVDFFETARALDFAHCAHEFHEDVEAGHGRVEVRRYWQSTCLEGLRQGQAWSGLKTLGMTESERHVGEKISVERRYYISSLPLNVKAFSGAVRQHWGIENSLHWVLDVTYREDESRIRRGHGAENLSTLRRLTLNLLKQETTAKTSQKQKRQRAGWDDTYRQKVLFGRTL
jgi:predicted transposase YbfD/YdcC